MYTHECTWQGHRLVQCHPGCRPKLRALALNESLKDQTELPDLLMVSLLILLNVTGDFKKA